jgi:hypothetical protein
MNVTRRGALVSGAAVVLHATIDGVTAAEPIHISVTKDPGCTCCDGWATHLRDAGYSVSIVESTELAVLKGQLGIPADLRACHTATVERYVLEGHVPALAVAYLLREKPERVVGLAVPGMPVGAPGMEVPGASPEEYSVFLFGPAGRKVWSKFRGTASVK